MTQYQISRNGQMYGPYTLEDLQRYVASGNVLSSDLAKSDEMSEWIPVSQLLGTHATTAQSTGTGFDDSGFTSTPAASDNAGIANPGFTNPGYIAPGNVAPAYAAPGYGGPAQPAFNASAYPDAPNLNWGIVLLIDAFTCGLFQYVWNIIVAAWLKKVQPDSKSLLLYIAVVVLVLVQFALVIPTIIAAVHAAAVNPGAPPPRNYVGNLFGLLTWITRLVARFMQRSALEQHFNTVENVGLRLNPVMTFFFGGLYFQYHLNKINEYKQATRMSQPAAY